MNKKYIIYAALIAMVAFLIYDTAGLGGKSDLFGMSPGMAQDETLKVVSQKGWKCTRPYGRTFDCEGEPAKLQLIFAAALKGNPLLEAHAFIIRPGVGPEETASEISSQYGRKPHFKNIDGYQWKLRDGHTLNLINGTITITNEELKRQDQSAWDSEERTNKPMPKL